MLKRTYSRLGRVPKQFRVLYAVQPNGSAVFVMPRGAVLVAQITALQIELAAARDKTRLVKAQLLVVSLPYYERFKRQGETHWQFIHRFKYAIRPLQESEKCQLDIQSVS